MNYDIFKKVRGIYGSSYFVSYQPDNPFIFEGPDILMSKQGTMIAMFALRNIEKKNLDLLKLRVILSRLAYPSNLSCIFLTEEALGLFGDETFFGDIFDDYFSMQEIENNRKYFDSFDFKKSKKSRLMELKDFLYKNYYTHYSISLNLININKIKEVSPQRFKSKNSILEYDFDSSDDSMHYIISNNEIIFFNQEKKYWNWYKKSAVVFKSILNYKLSGELDFSKSQNIQDLNKKIKYLNISDYPHFYYDPNKALRACAFIGCLLINTNNYEDIQKVTKRIEAENGY